MSIKYKPVYCIKIKEENLIYVKMGDLNEQHYESDIFERYGTDLTRTGNSSNGTHFKTYDWKSKTHSVELKSRNCESSVYSTTMVGYNKLEELMKEHKQGKRCFFMFGFLDGLYEWEITQENFDLIGGDYAITTYENKGTDYTPFNSNKLHIYIPIEKLILVSNKRCLIPDDLIYKSKYNLLGKCLIKF